jgi:hypothetical protein
MKYQERWGRGRQIDIEPEYWSSKQQTKPMRPIKPNYRRILGSMEQHTSDTSAGKQLS